MSELLAELRDHWNDGYWWADRPLLSAVLVGLIGLVYTALEVWLRARYGGER